MLLPGKPQLLLQLVSRSQAALLLLVSPEYRGRKPNALVAFLGKAALQVCGMLSHICRNSCVLMLDNPALLLRKKVSLTFGPYAFENVYCEQPASPAEAEGTCFQAKRIPRVMCSSRRFAIEILPQIQSLGRQWELSDRISHPRSA